MVDAPTDLRVATIDVDDSPLRRERSRSRESRSASKPMKERVPRLFPSSCTRASGSWPWSNARRARAASPPSLPDDHVLSRVFGGEFSKADSIGLQQPKERVHMQLKSSVLLVLCAATAQGAFAQTVLADLGGGGTAQALNDQGQVVGMVFDPVNHVPLPARWNNGVLSVLDTGTFGEAQSLNIGPDGRFVAGKGGEVYISPAGRPVVWDEAGTLRVLPDLGFGGVATGVNNLGVVVGVVYDSDFTSRAARWSANGTLQLLPTINSTERFSGALEINSSGNIAGFSYNEPFYEVAVRWGAQGPVLLDDAAWNFGRALAIAENDSVLYISQSRTTFAQTWFTQRPDGVRTVVQPLEPSLHFTAKDINSAQNVVGFGSVPNSDDPIRIRAAVWVEGQPQVLPVPNEATYSMAYGINEAGGVAGVLYDTLTNSVVAVTWAPVPGSGSQAVTVPDWDPSAKASVESLQVEKGSRKSKR